MVPTRPDAIRTKAVRHGDDWILNGEKLWITHAARADYGVVYARTEAGISCFIVETDTPGLTFTELPVVRDAWPYRITLDDVRVPARNLLGEEGRGLLLAGVFLQRGRLVYAARSVGIAEEALRMAKEWERTVTPSGRRSPRVSPCSLPSARPACASTRPGC